MSIPTSQNFTVTPQTTITTQPESQPVAGHNKIGPGPTGLICIACDKPIITRAVYSSTSHTHIVSAALCVVCSCCCGCFLPYCMKSCKVVNHFCPECKAFLGTYVPS